MELLRSFWSLFTGTLKRVYWLFPALITDPFDVLERLGINMNIPQWVSWLLFSVGLVIAITLTYHELRQKNKVANEKLVKQEWEYARKRRIELIEKEEYPRKIPDILKRMGVCIDNIYKNEQKKDISLNEIWDSLHGITPEDFYEVVHQKDYDENTTVLYKFYRRIRLTKSALTLNEESYDEWVKIEDEFEDIKKDIPDMILKDTMMAYYHSLRGKYNLSLYYYHLNKASSSDLKNNVAQLLNHLRYPEDLLDYCLTRCVKRIQELMSGDEPYWTKKEILRWK